MARTLLTADAALGRVDELRSLFDLDPRPEQALSQNAATLRLSYLTLAIVAALAASALIRLAVGDPAHVELAWLACGSAVGLLGLVGMMKYRPWPPDLAPPFVMLVCLIGLLNLLADVTMFGRPQAGMFLPLLLLGAAGAVAAWEWLTLITAVCVGCWFVVVAGFCAEPQWLAYGLLQVGALVLSGLWLNTRRTMMQDHRAALERQGDLELAAVDAERQERELRTRLRLIESQVRDVVLEREQRERQNQNLEKRLWQAREELRQQTEAAAAARAELDGLALEVAELRSAAAEGQCWRQRAESLSAELANGGSAAADLRKQLETVQLERDQLSALVAEVEQAHAKVAERAQRLEAEAAAASEYQRQLDETLRQLSQATQKAEARQADLDLLCQELPLGCLLLRRDGKVVAANPTAQNWLADRSFTELVNFRQPPTRKTRGNPWAELWRKLEREGRWQWEAIWPATSHHVARTVNETYILLPGRTDEEPLVCVLLDDRSAALRWEEQLAQQSEELEQLRAKAASPPPPPPAPIDRWSFEPGSQKWHWPESVRGLLANPPAATQQLVEALAWVHPEDQAGVQGVLAGATGFHHDLRLLAATGKYEWHRLTAQAGACGWTGTLCNIHDVRSAWQEAQDSLSWIQQQSWPAQFCLNYLGTEVRTHLTLQLDAAEQLVSAPAESPERLRAVTQVRRLAEHLRLLGHNILELARFETQAPELAPQTVPLPKLIHELVDRARRHGRARDTGCELRCPGWLPRLLRRDPERLRQLFTLLARLAMQQTDVGAIVWTWRLQEGARPHLVSTLEDRGCGFASCDLGLLLAPQLTPEAEVWRRLGGAGIALRLAWHLARALGGALEVRPAAPHGAIYELHLPLHAEEMLELVSGEEVLAPPPSMPSLDEVHGTKRLRGRVLLADDNKDNQLVLSCHLDRLGVEVDNCVSVEEALHLLHDHRYDVVLLDGQMPGLDGLAAVRLLRAEHAEVPILVMSPHVPLFDPRQCLEAGGNEVMAKPVDLVELFLTLARYLPVRESASNTTEAETIDPLRSPYQDDAEFRGLLREFVRALPERTAELRSAMGSADLARIIKLAHQLKGAAGMYGYPPLADAVEQLEDAALVGFDASRLRQLLREVERQSRRCERGLAA